MIQALIFDLDSCLASAREVGEDLYQPAFEAIRHANRETITDEALDRAFKDVWRHPLDWVAEHHHFSHEMRQAGWDVFKELAVQRPMKGYGDLAVLSEFPAKRFLVTSGFRRLQESKIEALNLRPLFTAIYIDAIDEPDRLGKSGYFAQILKQHRLTPSEVLVVGDNAESEIAAGNKLGISTAQTLRPGVPYASNATFHVTSLDELKRVLADINRAR